MSLWSRLFHSATGDQYHKGIRYFNDGDYDRAIACLEQVVVEDRTRESPVAKLGAFYASEAHSKLGVAEFHRRNYDRALEHFASALKINPHYPDLYYYLGVVHHKKNDLPAAIRMSQGGHAAQPGVRGGRLLSRYRLAGCRLFR